MNKIILSFMMLIILASPAQALVILPKEATDSARQNRIKTKEENKTRIIEKINSQLSQLNKKATAAFDRHLTSIQDLLNKVTAWKNKAKTNEKDVTAAETAINATQTAIDEAKTANEAQKLKIYTIEFTDESGLRIGASTAKTSLRTDLNTIKEKVKTARQKLIEAIKTVKQL